MDSRGNDAFSNCRFTLTLTEKETVAKQVALELEQVPAIRFAFLHGSFLEDRPCHDIDVAVYFQEQAPPGGTLEQAISLSVRLSQLLGIPVDLHELNSASLAFAYYATRGRLLFCRDAEEAYTYRERTWMLYLDFEPFLKQNLLDLLVP